MLDIIVWSAVLIALFFGFWLILSGLLRRSDKFLLAYDDADEISAA